MGISGYRGPLLDTALDFHTYKPRFYRLTAQGAELVTDFKNRPKGMSEADAVAQLIAQLGDEGWELVGVDHILYFKRPKS